MKTVGSLKKNCGRFKALLSDSRSNQLRPQGQKPLLDEAQVNMAGAQTAFGDAIGLAINVFDLGLHPGWKEAEENRALAVTRRDRLQIQGGNMTEGMEEGNETVINLNAKYGQSSPDNPICSPGKSLGKYGQ